MNKIPKIYSYICHLCQPLGVGSDDDGDPAPFNVEKGILGWCPDSDGVGREPGEPRPEGVLPGRVSLPHGTMMKRAIAMLKDAGITNVLAHTIPPHPDSDLAKIIKPLSYPELPFHERRANMWHNAGHFNMNGGESQIAECDGTYEDALREVMHSDCDCGVCDDFSIITSAPVNAISSYLHGLSPIEPLFKNHPILRHVNDLYPMYKLDGRSLDIWSPYAVDYLEYFYRSLFGKGRNIKGLWLTLGGPFLWGESCDMGYGNFYYIRTKAAAKALLRTDYIDMNKEGKEYAPIITARVGRIAQELATRLKDLTKNFYFHVYTIPPQSDKSGWQAAGMVGVAREVCKRMSEIHDIKAHMICSHGHEASSECTQEAFSLMKDYPNIEFISGVGWGNKLHTNGVARLCEGWDAVEVGLQDHKQWTNLKLQVSYIKHMFENIV